MATFIVFEYSPIQLLSGLLLTFKNLLNNCDGNPFPLNPHARVMNCYNTHIITLITPPRIIFLIAIKLIP
jgi:hypothetical protein